MDTKIAPQSTLSEASVHRKYRRGVGSGKGWCNRWALPRQSAEV